MPKYKPNDAGTEGLDRIQRLEKHVADSPTLTPSSSLDNVIQPTAAGAVPFVLKARSGQTADLLQIQDSSGVVLGGFSATGGLNGGSQPATFERVLQAVASRPNTGYKALTGSSSTETFRTAHVALANITSLTLLYGNAYGNSNGPQGDGAGNLTVTCSIEYPVGTIRRCYTSGGSRTATVEPGGTARFEAPVVIPKGTVFYIRTYASGQWPTGMIGNYALGVGYDNVTFNNALLASSLEGDNGAAGADITATGTITAVEDNPHSPYAILGTTPDGLVPCVGFVGDSIINGANDITDMGFMYRALANTKPYLKLCQPGEKAQDWAAQTNSHIQQRMQLLRYLTHAVCAYGRNDVTNSRTLAQMQADLITIWTQLLGAGVKTWQTTVTPRTTSTDGWVTTANQTATSNDAARISLNAWIRDGAPILNGAAAAAGSHAAGTVRTGDSGHPLVGWIELADTCESARDSGLWTVPGSLRTVTDAAITTGTKTLTSSTAAFTSADVGKGVWVAGAGAAGVGLGAQVVKVGSGTSVTLDTSAGTTVSAATASVGTATYDGTHPVGAYHALLAALIPVSQFTV